MSFTERGGGLVTAVNNVRYQLPPRVNKMQCCVMKYVGEEIEERGEERVLLGGEVGRCEPPVLSKGKRA